MEHGDLGSKKNLNSQQNGWKYLLGRTGQRYSVLKSFIKLIKIDQHGIESSRKTITFGHSSVAGVGEILEKTIKPFQKCVPHKKCFPANNWEISSNPTSKWKLGALHIQRRYIFLFSLENIEYM